jgi:hypothetical protein
VISVRVGSGWTTQHNEEDDANPEDQAQAAFDNFVQLWTTGTTAGRRAPVLRRPDEVGLEYEDVYFPSIDGVPLEGWFIPADSDRLIIHNHFLPGNRYGYPGHLPEFGGLGGFEVSFLPEYKALHDAGYNILAYDIRNHGLSGQGSGGIAAIGLLEYRDVIGSLRYASSRPDTKAMKKVLLSRSRSSGSTSTSSDGLFPVPPSAPAFLGGEDDWLTRARPRGRRSPRRSSPPLHRCRRNRMSR